MAAPLTWAIWVRMRALNLDASDQYQNSWQGRRPSIRTQGSHVPFLDSRRRMLFFEVKTFLEA